MFVSRGQAQNAADAGALAAATSLAFWRQRQFGALAQDSAIATARQNLVWGEPPDSSRRMTWPFRPLSPWPPGVPGHLCASSTSSARATRAVGGNPLPTFFANIFGVGEQGTRATATAQMLAPARAPPTASSPGRLPTGGLTTLSRPVRHVLALRAQPGAAGFTRTRDPDELHPSDGELDWKRLHAAGRLWARQLTLTLGAAGSSIVPGGSNPVEIDVAAATGMRADRQCHPSLPSVPVGGGTTLGRPGRRHRTRNGGGGECADRAGLLRDLEHRRQRGTGRPAAAACRPAPARAARVWSRFRSSTWTCIDQARATGGRQHLDHPGDRLVDRGPAATRRRLSLALPPCRSPARCSVPRRIVVRPNRDPGPMSRSVRSAESSPSSASVDRELRRDASARHRRARRVAGGQRSSLVLGRPAAHSTRDSSTSAPPTVCLMMSRVSGDAIRRDLVLILATSSLDPCRFSKRCAPAIASA